MEELQQMVQMTTIKLTTMHKALAIRDDIDGLYVSWKGGRVLTSIEDSVDTSIKRLEDYIKPEQRNADYRDKQHKQHKHQQNNNN